MTDLEISKALALADAGDLTRSLFLLLLSEALADEGL